MKSMIKNKTWVLNEKSIKTEIEAQIDYLKEISETTISRREN
jgi:hypothetical protein